MHARLFLQPDRRLKKHLCKHRIILIGHRVAGKKRMDAEFFNALSFQYMKCLKQLLRGHAVLGIPRIVHNVIADLKKPARIVPAAYRLRNTSDCPFQKINMGNVIQVDDCPQLIRILILLCRSVI